MGTYIIMLFIMAFLGFELIIGAKTIDDTHFFNKDNTNALRGFWCLIIILVHVPAAYQNKMQDMIGSFAYIGVTFFFMTSAYGLRLSVEKGKNVNGFWRRRLPKLLIPCLLVNIIRILFNIIEGSEFSVWNFVTINGWVLWLLVCYLIFWTSYKFIGGGYQDLTICILVIVFSVVVYLFKYLLTQTTWCSEVYGFIWGIMLFRIKNIFIAKMKNKWTIKCLILCIFAVLLGMGYLKLKTVVFWGDYFLKILLGLSITIFMLAINTRVSIGNRVSNFLGSISYEIYLLHGAVFGLIATQLPSVSSGVFILLSILVTVVFSTIAHKFGRLLLG